MNPVFKLNIINRTVNLDQLLSVFLFGSVDVWEYVDPPWWMFDLINHLCQIQEFILHLYYFSVLHLLLAACSVSATPLTAHFDFSTELDQPTANYKWSFAWVEHESQHWAPPNTLLPTERLDLLALRHCDRSTDSPTFHSSCVCLLQQVVALSHRGSRTAVVKTGRVVHVTVN